MIDYIQRYNISGYVSLTSRASIQPFICEISNPNIRGFTTSLYILCYILGQALTVLAADEGELGWRYVSGTMGALMILCFLVLLLWIHETPDWLLERCSFDQATKSLEFYKIDRKVLVDDDQKRKTINGEEKSYSEIVALYRQESNKSSNSTNDQRGPKIENANGSMAQTMRYLIYSFIHNKY